MFYKILTMDRNKTYYYIGGLVFAKLIWKSLKEYCWSTIKKIAPPSNVSFWHGLNSRTNFWIQNEDSQVHNGNIFESKSHNLKNIHKSHAHHTLKNIHNSQAHQIIGSQQTPEIISSKIYNFKQIVIQSLSVFPLDLM